MISIIIASAVSVFIYMTSVFVLAQFIKNNSIVDIAWGPGFFIIALVQLILKPNPNINDSIISLIVFIWALRLSVHIYFRSRGKQEDFRYAQWRKEWGDKAMINAFVRVFMLQGLIMLVVALPIMLTFYNSHGSHILFSFAGLLIYVLGLSFESIGDYQLYKFKKNKDNKGKIIQSGLWKFTRHPNYFGEAVLWWGIGIYAIGIGSSIAALTGPLVINLLLVYVSGIPLLEKKYEGNTEWGEYKINTPAFIPLIGKKG